MAFLRHSEQCLFPSPQNAFCFTDLSLLVLKIFRFFKKHAQNLNTPQNILESWDLQLGFNSEFKGLTAGMTALKPFQIMNMLGPNPIHVTIHTLLNNIFPCLCNCTSRDTVHTEAMM